MAEVRRSMFPYGMAKNPDGSWTLFNRQYKPLGVISKEWEDWDDPKHKMLLKGLGPATLAKLDWRGDGADERIYFYNDGCIPTDSSKDMKSYLAKLEILMKLNVVQR
ncbi:MAG: hypothetical protein LC634_04060 [Sphingomonadales bacterium]|nr:hypothetical protein [Sphingomonadales bacterium]